MVPRVLLLLIAVVTPSLLFPQTPDWSNLRFSVRAEWIAPQRDFGTYWMNGPGIGLNGAVPVEGGFSLAAMGVFSWHAPAETPRKSSIPQILLFQLGGGILVTQGLFEGLDGRLTVQLVNNAFIMTGPAVRPGFENAIESEFGIVFTAGLTLHTSALPEITVFGSYQPIFVGLDPVATVSLGLAVGLER